LPKRKNPIISLPQLSLERYDPSPYPVMHFDDVALKKHLEHDRLVDVAHPHPIADEFFQSSGVVVKGHGMTMTNQRAQIQHVR